MIARPRFIQLWEAVVRFADRRAPEADVKTYVTPLLPWNAPPDQKRRHAQLPGVTWHPFDRPRMSEGDVAWLWLEDARRSIRQALVDGELIALHLQIDGVAVPLAQDRWRTPEAMADLRVCRPAWLRAGEGILLPLAAFKSWLEDDAAAPEPPSDGGAKPTKRYADAFLAAQYKAFKVRLGRLPTKKEAEAFAKEKKWPVARFRDLGKGGRPVGRPQKAR